MKKIIVLSSCGILLIILAVIFLYRWVPDSMVIKTEAELNKIGIITYQRPAMRGEKMNPADLYIEEYCTAKILGIFPLKTVKVYIFEDTEVILGGMLFGVQFGAGNVYIADLFEAWDGLQVRSPGKEAGLKLLDVVKEIDGVAVTTTTEAEMALHRANGQDITIKVIRDGIEIEAVITPDKSGENFYFYGVQFQDYVIGVGTLSYINEKNNSFGGFGHGVKASNADTLLPVENSIVLSAQYRGLAERTESSTGEIMVNYLGEVGNVVLNSSTGVYGYLHSMPNARKGIDATPVGLRGDITAGEAIMYSTVGAEGVQAYTIEILEVYDKTIEHKDFLIKVTDESLLSGAGGIVQGMSGSPIVQNGKLVGVLSHVIMHDNTKGYGIFAYNMIINS